MLPEITIRLLFEYLVLFLILAPITFFVVRYHASLPKEEREIEEVPEAEAEPMVVASKVKEKKPDINQLYKELKQKYNPAKAGDKKTRLKNKQIMSKIEKAYKIKDLKTLMSL